jgi:hypothetical protein
VVPELDAAALLRILNEHPVVASVTVVADDSVGERAYLRVRCPLVVPGYALEARWIRTPWEFLYSYQLFSDRPLRRWDNAPHHAAVATHPHHFHEADRSPGPSPLAGVPERDLPYVLDRIAEFLAIGS